MSNKRDTKKGTKAPEAPRVDVNEMLEQIKELSRQPFQNLLARLLSAAPAQNEVADFARKHVDKWAASCAVFARPSGYTPQLSVDVDVGFRAILQLSDAEKLALIKAYEQQQKTIDVSPTQTPAEPQSHEALRRNPPENK